MSSIEDRLAINDTLQGYAKCIDELDFVALGALFTDDAIVEYGGYSVMRGGAETARFLQGRTSSTSWHQHNVTVVEVRIDGDTAATIAYFVAYAVSTSDSETVRLSVGEYRDRLRRTPDGWLICERRQHTGWKEVRTRSPL